MKLDLLKDSAEYYVISAETLALHFAVGADRQTVRLLARGNYYPDPPLMLVLSQTTCAWSYVPRLRLLPLLAPICVFCT